MSATPVFDKICKMLDDNGVEYKHFHHEPTKTSEEAARVRGESTKIGGKALLIKANDSFHLFVLSAALKLNNKAIKQHLNSKKPRFATHEELMELTGLVPGSVPPFGEPILPFPLYVDESIIQNERIAFNAGSLADSIIMSVEDYQRVTEITAVVDVGVNN